MTTHVPLDLWFAVTAAVAVVIGFVAIGAWRVASGDVRAPVVAGLTAWLAADVALAAVGAFAATIHRPVPVIAVGIVLPVLVGIWLLGRSDRLRRLVDSVPLHSLIDVQIYRVVGGVFILAWALGRMPAIFALTAGVGDVAVGVAAPFVAARVERAVADARRLAVIWNLAGIADLVIAVMLGAATSPTPLWPALLGHPNPLISRLPFVLIPIFAVPLSVILHVIALGRLNSPDRDGSDERPRRDRRPSGHRRQSLTE
jgi:hypothetical protein